ncbi:MAG: bifunctional phosphopantothenoylcysteine decarboxylase/phosphopantothenate--cysteine ligase CoaBC [Xanthomonadales bacterium]|nr:bifunctional phosphopantothenoylcysteine decarboxylase/phosphopantothenate--cysteine ligase CoaBC [Xanthomonadales bacterium]MBK7144419.1 bifunctional phosphopantothenoylcysteine decarboxylase/phosphopantothenate--cysteine ligase CoaBC [Xanthomonadales bacterium]
MPQQALARAVFGVEFGEAHAGFRAGAPVSPLTVTPASATGADSARISRNSTSDFPVAASLQGLRCLLGVSGGIAAYKSADLVRRLRDAGAEVQVVLTENAARFVTAQTFQALSGRPVRSSLWDEAAEAAMGHIELARWADAILVAPASADLIARLAHGRADDLLSTLCLASEAPLLLAPAMNRVMWAQAATQANVALLLARSVQLLGPASGEQACGEHGAGRMLEPPELVEALAQLRARSQSLAGRHVLVNAGPTFEDIDPVRFIGNRSSGRMGFAIAAAAAAAGARVTLVAGPVELATPRGVARVDVRSAREMQAAVFAALTADVFIATAAVADYRIAAPCASKIKRSSTALTLELVPNPDIVASVAAHAQRPRLVVAFAAETENVIENARGKLSRKRVDLVCANRVGADCGFERADNALDVVAADGEWHWPQAPKTELARRLVALVAERLGAVR